MEAGNTAPSTPPEVFPGGDLHYPRADVGPETQGTSVQAHLYFPNSRRPASGPSPGPGLQATGAPPGRCALLGAGPTPGQLILARSHVLGTLSLPLRPGAPGLHLFPPPPITQPKSKSSTCIASLSPAPFSNCRLDCHLSTADQLLKRPVAS